MLETRAGIVGRAVGYGLMPPIAALVGVSQGAFDDTVARPLILGSALWVALALALATYAIVRLERRTGRSADSSRL